MLIFKTKYDLQQINPAHPFNQLILNLLRRTGHLDGYVILIEKGDNAAHLPELKKRLADIPWEGVTKVEDFFYGVYLTNNEFALEFVIPDRPWLSPAIRANLEAHLSEF